MGRRCGSAEQHRKSPADNEVSIRSSHSSSSDQIRSIDGSNSLHRRQRRPAGCMEKFGRVLFPLLIFISFFFNFTFVDVGTVSRKYDTIMTPPNMTFFIWIVIYVLEFAFVLYQLLASKARNSDLLQRKIAIPFILHQILSAAWLGTFSRERIYAASGICLSLWLVALFIFAQIAKEFRTGRYQGFSIVDYCFLEIPFAFLLGWETVALLLNANVLAVKLEIDRVISPLHGHAPQIAVLIVAYSIITAAAILLAGLPMLMDPFCHLPIIWACVMIGMRCQDVPLRPGSPHLLWVTREVSEGVKWASWVSAGIVAIFFLAAALILCSSGICAPVEYSISESETERESPTRDRRGGQQQQQPHHRLSEAAAAHSPSSSAHRSPRTARSAMSAERIV